MKLRKAHIKDVKTMHELISRFAARGEMLPKSRSELYDQIRDFFVYEEDGTIGGTCALHVSWDDLAEIRSLAVREEYWGRGVGETLVKACIGEAKSLGVQRVFALTYRKDFFKRLDFVDYDKSKLPHKIWADCLKCSKFPDCDEEAVMLMLEEEEKEKG